MIWTEVPNASEITFTPIQMSGEQSYIVMTGSQTSPIVMTSTMASFWTEVGVSSGGATEVQSG